MRTLLFIVAAASVTNFPSLAQTPPAKDPKSAIETFSLMMGYMLSCASISGRLSDRQLVSIDEAAEKLGYNKADRSHARLVDIHIRDLFEEMKRFKPREKEEKCLETKIMFDNIFPK